MDKLDAVAEVNRRRDAPPLGVRETHFANVNRRKPVWWLEIPLSALSNAKTSAVNLLLAEGAEVFHLQVPNAWIIEHIDGLVIRKDKPAIALELSAATPKFRDVRPTSAGLDFAQFLL